MLCGSVEEVVDGVIAFFRRYYRISKMLKDGHGYGKPSPIYPNGWG
jgi:hypothetical protein